MMIAGTKLEMGDSTIQATGSVTPLERKQRMTVPVEQLDAPATRQPLRSKVAFDGVFIVDGKPVSPELANRINPNNISSIEVVKGEAARLQSNDPRAANGIILITTKRR
jgi:hypothetical protein